MFQVTPLQVSCELGHVEIVKLLLEREEIDVNKTSLRFKLNTPLRKASSFGHFEIVKLLLEMEDIDVRKGDPIAGAVRYDEGLRIMKLLLSHKDTDLCDSRALYNVMIDYEYIVNVEDKLRILLKHKSMNLTKGSNQFIFQRSIKNKENLEDFVKELLYHPSLEELTREKEKIQEWRRLLSSSSSKKTIRKMIMKKFRKKFEGKTYLENKARYSRFFDDCFLFLGCGGEGQYPPKKRKSMNNDDKKYEKAYCGDMMKSHTLKGLSSKERSRMRRQYGPGAPSTSSMRTEMQRYVDFFGKTQM